MSQELVSVSQTLEIAKKLMQVGHYAKMGQEGIFAVVETAKALGIDPLIALNGGMYYCKGHVEMTARMMNTLIRSKKHSISQDVRSDDKICILHGKRSDNGDIWTESFSIEEAQRAGIAHGDNWKKYPKDMLFARALSRLARQLFPDVIGNCYVDGEISNIPQPDAILTEKDLSCDSPQVIIEEPKQIFITQDRITKLNGLLVGFEDKKFVEKLFEYFNITQIPELLNEEAPKFLYHLTQKTLPAGTQ